MDNSSQSAAILQELRSLYPDAKPELNFSNPYETLIATMLSAQCTDKQVNKVTPDVFSRWPTIDAMANASLDELFPLVRSCGFKTKASNIIAACQMLRDEFNSTLPSTMESLTRLPGVGRKTANVVMANAFNIPALAVDTHVFRVSNRLGLAHANNVDETERQLKAVVPMQDWKDVHHRLIYHGRRVCKAQRPLCEECTLKPYCPSYPCSTSKNK